jgi:prolyl 3-hydroxylase /prolyl 3,4-dihydroxylase
MISDWINDKYLDESLAKELGLEYKNNVPFEHIQLLELIKEDKLEELELALEEEEFFEKDGDLFSLSQTNDLESSDNKIIKEFIQLLNSVEFRDLIKKITGVKTTPGKLSLFGAIYGPGDYLLCHDDKLDNRKLAFIIYLSTLNKNEGGELALYTDKNSRPEKEVKTYSVVKNSCVIFTVSDISWHEVKEVKDSYRVSIGGWLND